METENVGRTGCLFVDKGGSGDQRLNLVLCNPTFPLQPSQPQRALLRNYDETMLTMMTNRLMPTAMARSRPLTCRRAASSPHPPSTPPHTCCPEQTVVYVQNSISNTEHAKSVAILAIVPYLPSRESVICLKMST